MPEPPYAPLTFVSENVLTDTVYSLGIMFPLLLARFQEFDRREAEGVGDMPIATQDLGGTSELVRTQWFQRVLCHSRPPFRRATPPGDVGVLLGSGQRVPASRRAWTTVGGYATIPLGGSRERRHENSF